MLQANHRILAWFCGKGADINWLAIRKFKVLGYDPYPPCGYTDVPGGKFDQVLITYQMTRLKTDEKRKEVIGEGYEKLRPGGFLILSCRNYKSIGEESFETREACGEYLKSLVAGYSFESIDFPALETEGNEICMLARRSGVYHPKWPIDYIDTQNEMDFLCNALMNEESIALDVETTLDEPRQLCTVQLGVHGRNYIIDAIAVENLDALKRLMENDAVEKVIHNAFFEEQVLGQYGIGIRNIFDTLHESRKFRKKQAIEGGHKLGEVCERELDIYLDKTMQISDWTQRPLSPQQLEYAAIDVEVLVLLTPIFKPDPPPENLSLFEDMG